MHLNIDIYSDILIENKVKGEITLKKIISIIIVMIMLTVPAFAAAREFEQPADDLLNIVIDGGTSPVEAYAGTEVAVCIRLVNNKAISSLKLSVSYDEKLSVTKSSSGRARITFDIRDPEDSSVFTQADVHEDERTIDLNWVSGTSEVTGDCIFATIKFKVSKEAENGEFLPVTVAAINPNDVFDIDFNNIPFNVINGGVDVVSVMKGDVDGDGRISDNDVITLMKYVSGSEPDVFFVTAADYNDDEEIDDKDVAALFAAVCEYTYALPDIEQTAEEVPEDKLGIVIGGGTDRRAVIGKTVDVKINLTNNPGINSLKTVVYWSDVLELVDAKYDIYDPEDTSAWINTVEDWSAVKDSFAFNWVSADTEVAEDVTFVTLTFNLPEGTEDGKFLYVAVTADNIFNSNGKEVDFVFLSGGVNATEVTVGDPTGDGSIDNKDVVTLFRYVSSDEVDEVMDAASDFTEDGEVNNKDVVALFRFISTIE